MQVGSASEYSSDTFMSRLVLASFRDGFLDVDKGNHAASGSSLAYARTKFGGEGGIRTHVPVSRQDAFEAPPLRPLRYLSAYVVGGGAVVSLSPALRSGDCRCVPGVRRYVPAASVARAPAVSRRRRKNACINSRHSASSTPPTALTRWLSAGLSSACATDCTAPHLGAGAPYTSVAIRACTSAPAHMRHGSTVTYSTAPGSRVVAEGARGRPQRDHLGVRGRVAGADRLIEAGAGHLPIVHHHGADGHLARCEGQQRLVERGAHPALVPGVARGFAGSHVPVP